ncbi:sigma-54-dependent Fis family transcriptional regulator [Desulfovibrio subterraneus]|nr:sigma 54-interacting transcriptional regulator [Desulfovibrio subterraneus]
MVEVKTFHFTNERIQALLLQMGQQRSTGLLFKLIVDHLSAFNEIALARIWLVRRGDSCSSCLLAEECGSQDKCLHLVASAGHSQVDKTADWTRLDGAHRRFPMGARKVGHIAALGVPVIIESIQNDSKWIAHPDWARKEHLESFAGYPMRFQGEILGVLAVFTKNRMTQSALDVLGIIANHAASALANAMAFEKIQALTKQLEAENDYLREELSDVASAGGFVGRSASLHHVIDQIDLVAPSNANVLILGESGTGKELVAWEVHQKSSRRSKPLVRVNCASVPKELFSSEFFGHTRGAFTGALADRAGKFGAAHQGTLFLDEIGEIPMEQQAQLLRVLQEGEYERLGEEKIRKVDVRIIAATNRDLKKEMQAGRFREDLYFRLNVFPITIPPLRERREDIEPLADHFLKRCLRDMNRSVFSFTPAQIDELVRYDWPGNVRELQNVVERFAISSSSRSVRPGALGLLGDVRNCASFPPSADASSGVLTENDMMRLQKQNIENALRLCNGKIYGPDGAASLLGVRPTTLSTRIKAMKIGRK